MHSWDHQKASLVSKRLSLWIVVNIIRYRFQLDFLSVHINFYLLFTITHRDYVTIIAWKKIETCIVETTKKPPWWENAYQYELSSISYAIVFSQIFYLYKLTFNFFLLLRTVIT